MRMQIKDIVSMVQNHGVFNVLYTLLIKISIISVQAKTQEYFAGNTMVCNSVTTCITLI